MIHSHQVTLLARGGRPVAATLAALATLALSACGAGDGEPLAELSGPIMGTRYSVKVVPPPASDDRERLAAEVDEILQRVNARMSTYLADSEVSLLNAASPGEWMPVSADTYEVLAEAQRIARLTSGAFDVTVGPLVNLWGFGPEARAEPPDEDTLTSVRRSVGFERLEIRPAPFAARSSTPDLYVDLSAIAKGYAVDAVAAHLETRGIDRYLVEVGGELRASGRNHLDEPWRLAIEKPLDGARTIHRVLHLEDAGVATSGDYRNFYELDGKRHSHTIDPRTGRPVDHQLASVTVIAPSAMLADAMATAFMVLGPDEGYALAEREELAALFLIRTEQDFDERVTTRMKAYVATPLR